MKTYVFIYGFLPKYLCIHMWKIITTMKIIIIWIIQHLSLKFIPFRFYIWKIGKIKSFSLVIKKRYPNCEYAQVCNQKHKTQMGKGAFKNEPKSCI
jgi:hypothetical protein